MLGSYHSRQSFLGARLPELLATVRVGVVGVSGGGSHIVQQLAHVGFQRYALFDDDRIEEGNLHRFVGATREDVEEKMAKVAIGERIIRGIWPDAEVQAHQAQWQDRVEALRTVDLVFGCLDGIRARLDLETTARRYLLPLIDLGLGMRGEKEKLMVGQVALSLPGGPCLRCLGLLTERELTEEAAHSGEYPGFGGHAPQVVWANGVLASTAVGVALDLLTGWSKLGAPSLRLQYFGNAGLVEPYEKPVPATCPHFSGLELGDHW